MKDIFSVLVVMVGIYLFIFDVSLGNDVIMGIVIGILLVLFFVFRNIVYKCYFS